MAGFLYYDVSSNLLSHPCSVNNQIQNLCSVRNTINLMKTACAKENSDDRKPTWSLMSNSALTEVILQPPPIRNEMCLPLMFKGGEVSVP